MGSARGSFGIDQQVGGAFDVKVVDASGNPAGLAFIDEHLADAKLLRGPDDFRLTLIKLREEQGIGRVLAGVDPGLGDRLEETGLFFARRLGHEFLVYHAWYDDFAKQLERQHFQSDTGQPDQGAGIANDASS